MRDSGRGVAVGRVLGLWRYPVKSMSPQELTDVEVSWHGLAGDRRWAFVRSGVMSGFPWFTLREHNTMNDYQPSFVDPDRPDSSAVAVGTPSSETLQLTDPRLLRELGDGSGSDISLIKQGRGVFDTFPISLITAGTVTRLGEMVDAELHVQRFRPNILVETGNNEAFVEDSWVGRTLTIGSTRMRVDQRDGRCLVTTLDPQTGERNPAILRAVAQEREGCLGVYGSTVEPGRLAVGDAVSLEP